MTGHDFTEVEIIAIEEHCLYACSCYFDDVFLVIDEECQWAHSKESIRQWLQENPAILAELTALNDSLVEIPGEYTKERAGRLRDLVCSKKKESQMKPHQERVLTERKELAEKTEKLEKFVSVAPSSSETFNSLDAAEQGRLLEQLGAMKLYLKILDERIAAFK